MEEWDGPDEDLRNEAEETAPEAPARGFRFADAGRGTKGVVDVLSAWSVLEAMSPKTYSDPRDFADGMADPLDLAPDFLPWEMPDAPREGYRFYFRVDIGGIDLRKVSRAILDAYGWDEGEVGVRGSRAVMAMGMVDGRGAPVAKGFSISSFGWALPLVLGKSLGGMPRWGEVERDVVGELVERMSRPDPDNPDRLAAITWADVVDAHGWLVTRFGIPEEFVEPPSFSIRVEHRGKPGSVPHPFILNSFYLNDIDRTIGLVESGKAPRALRAFLGLDVPAKPIDVLRTHGALRHVLTPANMPAARWPVPEGHSLVTLQQAAANAAVAGLGGTQGVLSVNGPPGTGKTTLLRDLVASNVVDRAAAMVAFADPEKAFVGREEAREGGRNVYRLHESLRGYEMLVASSNNKAVENVSRELPLARSIHAAAGEPAEEKAAKGPRAFRATADFVAGNVREDGTLVDPDLACWGLVSAVMGNSGNRAAFMNRFWWSDDYGIRTWLRLARGENVQIPVIEKKTIVGNRPPRLLKTESPPRNWREAHERWNDVRRRFLAAREEILAELDRLEAYAHAVPAIEGLETALADAEAALADLERAARPVDALALRHARAQEDLDALEGVSARHDALEPRRPADGGGRAAWDIWDVEREELAARIQGAARTVARMGAALAEERAAGDDDGGVLAARRDAEDARDRLAEARAVIAEVEAAGRPVSVDAAFFEAGHAAWNVAVPWLSERIQARRSELFALAMEVHEAFVLAAARPFLANLSAYAELTGNGGASPELVPYASDLWSTLFLTVPVVSTTFASAGRMLNTVPPGSLGWLVVDEAGQATPQSALGAVTRFKRVLAVGDPLQVEPVVALPRRLSARICEHFEVDLAAFVAPTASVQGLADRASPLKATYDTIDGERQVGMPLLVHRRCSQPMFGIANRIAYAGQMVDAVKEGGDDGLRERVGDSAWYDVTGQHMGKWCSAQGDVVAAILARAGRGEDGKPIPGGPNVYVITPFRDVAANLRQRIRVEAGLFPGVDMKEWVERRIGTIHTFQGREADGVVLVLGAGTSEHAGARTWAGRAPNIANVAVTRARRALYVVGARAAWETAGAFAAVAEAVPVRPVPTAPVGSLRIQPRPRTVAQPDVAAQPSAPPPKLDLMDAIERFEDLVKLEM